MPESFHQTALMPVRHLGAKKDVGAQPFDGALARVPYETTGRRQYSEQALLPWVLTSKALRRHQAARIRALAGLNDAASKL